MKPDSSISVIFRAVRSYKYHQECWSFTSLMNKVGVLSNLKKGAFESIVREEIHPSDEHFLFFSECLQFFNNILMYEIAKLELFSDNAINIA